jgi:hypothetical protein
MLARFVTFTDALTGAAKFRHIPAGITAVGIVKLGERESL